MSISAGSRLGPYEVLSPLGAGGMGEVWKARDTRLGRDVAIKVLPEHLSSSPESRQRFEREAKTISQFSHPHICALYDVGSQDGVAYLVMELLEGETLAARLVRGALPLEQTLSYGAQIADALEKAHRQGIVHRDLKPGNIMLTKSGLKLLDFGLAKGLTPPGGKGSGSGRLTALPTAAGGPNLTQEGTILGTFQYMAPEQLEGKDADTRTDIFALGAVLYEMATGRKAFSGTSQASLITAIMSSEPAPISSISTLAPPALDRVVRTCLSKDPEERWQSAQDVGRNLLWIGEGGSQAALAGVATAPRKKRERLWQAVAAAGLLAAAILAGFLLREGRRPRRVLHTAIPPPPATSFWLEQNGPGPAVVSPDGTQIAFTAADQAGKVNLYVRPLASGEARVLAGTEGAMYPFWSPDTRSLGYFAAGKLKTIAASGGPPLTICNAAEGKGGSWSPSGVIVFAPNAQSTLSRVSEKGGEPSAVTRLDAKRGDDSHRLPHFLPDGRHFLYLARSQTSPVEGHAILVGSLDGGPEKLLLRSPAAARYAGGFVLYLRDTALMARPFDAGRLEFSAEAMPVAEHILIPAPNTAVAVFSSSGNGVLAYQTALGGTASRLELLERDGKSASVLGEVGGFREVALSPDGKQAVVALGDPASGTNDLWIFDLARGLRTRFTFDPADDRAPIWSHDGNTVVFSSSRKGHHDLYRKSIGGTSEEEPLLVTDQDKYASAWSPDGKVLVYSENSKDTDSDIWLLHLEGAPKPEPFLKTKATEVAGALSPDGRWLSYMSDESGQLETYVTSFPRAGRKWQISQAGGVYSYWSADGKEILYQRNDGLLAVVPVSVHGDSLDIGRSQTLFRANGPSPGGPEFSPTRDHRRILVVRGGQEPSPFVDLLVNWPDLLRGEK